MSSSKPAPSETQKPKENEKPKAAYNWDDEEEDDDFVALLLGEKNNLFPKPSLDQILDKMIDKGFENLTEFEKDILKSYSKN